MQQHKWKHSIYLNKAFTLFELMIVITLLVMLITLSSSRLTYTRCNARSVIEDLSIVIQYLQRRALHDHAPQKLIIDEVGNAYSYQGKTNKLPSGISFKVLPGVKGSPSTLTHELTSPVTFENHTITFNKQGAVSAGAVYITDNNVMYALTIPVGFVGYVRKYCYDGAWKELQ